MKKQTLFTLLLIAFSFLNNCGDSKPDHETSFVSRADSLSRIEMQSITEFLADDLLEGRAPGTRGSEIAEKYIKSLYKFLDFEPGAGDDYLQPFPMKGFTYKNLNVSINGTALDAPQEVAGTFTTEEKYFDLKREAVFVGFGIKAPAWDWDDYKDFDVKDKIVICRVNDPGMIRSDIFEGDTLTYYGRWTYHIEEAGRRGAAGILLIHTDQSAGYGWRVIENSWTGEQLFIDSDLDNSLMFRGWIKESALEEILKQQNISLEELYEKTAERDFQPKDPGLEVHISGENSFRSVEAANVVAEIPGKTEERIVLSAHIDHIGMDPALEGDNIYNGAIDNATAVAAMMLAAKILKEHQDELYYSITLLACNAEESGLLGSKYYVEHTNRDNIIANLNYESTFVWEESNSFMGIGARFSDFEPMIRKVAEKEDLEYSVFSGANEGMFYRSDQFSFARYGIPGIWLSAGEKGKSGADNYAEYRENTYHTVDDEFDPAWKLEGMKQTIKLSLMLVDEINRSRKSPEWRKDLPFPLIDHGP